MKISIITVAYNSASTIRDTLESVLAQTYQDIEYVLVDGDSYDNTLAIIKEYEPKFAGRLRWVSAKDNGIYDAMNNGLAIVTGDVVAILNSDDVYCDVSALEKVVSVFKMNEKLDSVYADMVYVSHDDTSRVVRRWTTGLQRPFKTGWHPAHPTMYIKRELFAKYGNYNLEFKLASDFELMLRFLEKHKMSTYYLKETLVSMRLGGASNKNLRNILSQNLECIRAFRINGLKVNPILYPWFRILPKLLQFVK